MTRRFSGPVAAHVVDVGDPMPELSLARVLASRRSLTASEVVTIGAPIAGVLAQLHASGFVHDRVDVFAILFAPDGAPMLDIVPAVVRDGPPTGSAAADVAALGALLRDAYDGAGTATDSLTAVLARATAPDPARRPTAAGFEAELLALDVAPANREATGPSYVDGRLPVRRRIVAAVAATLALVCAVVTGVAWAGAGEQPGAALTPPAARTPTEPPSSSALTVPSSPLARPAQSRSQERRPDWIRVLRRLDVERAHALHLRDSVLLDAVYTRHSAARAGDSVTIRSLLRRQVAPVGLRFHLTGVRCLNATHTGARLRVTDRLDAYALVDRRGRTVVRDAGRGPRTWLVTLRRTSHGWRIAAVDVRPLR